MRLTLFNLPALPVETSAHLSSLWNDREHLLAAMPPLTETERTLSPWNPILSVLP